MGDKSHAISWSERPVGRAATVALGLMVCFGPAWLFADALGTYRLHSDDFPYVAGSRTFARTAANLFAPHNTHIVPAWRLLTGGLMAAAGRLANLQTIFAEASYGIVVATMVLTGRLVSRETGRSAVGFAAMIVVG